MDHQVYDLGRCFDDPYWSRSKHPRGVLANNDGASCAEGCTDCYADDDVYVELYNRFLLIHSSAAPQLVPHHCLCLWRTPTGATGTTRAFVPVE